MTTVFLATTGQGLRRAVADDNGGLKAEPVASGYDVRCVAAHPSQAGTVFAGATGRGVLKSHDFGRSWHECGPGEVTVKSLASSRADPARVYAGAKPACLYVSADGGESWSELDSFRRIRSRLFWFSPAEWPFTAYVQALAVSPADANLVVAGIELGAVVRSTDGGRTWEDHRPGAMRDCHCLAAHASAPNWFYQGAGNGGGALSRDGGAHWQRLPGLDRAYGWAAAADVVDPALHYLSASPGIQAHSAHAAAAIFRSRGDRWERLAGGLPSPLDAMPYALLTGPGAGQVTAGLANGELWQSDDAGDTWRCLGSPFPGIHRSLLMLEDDS
jgi:photosystem II stability/assembly factor-like uncharacterized protein